VNTALANFLPLVNVALWHGFIVFLRVGAMVSLMPAFGEKSVPIRIKLVVILAFVLVIAPVVGLTDTKPNLDELAWLVVTETLSGLMLGLGIRMFVLALQTAGSIAAQSTSLSQILGGAVAEPLPAMGYVLIIGGLALAVMTGLHIKAIELVILSYDLLPIGTLPDGSNISAWGLGQIRHAFELAFTLAAPFVILSLIYNLALGAINKAMPQLMVAFVGAPVITAGGLFILFLASPIMLDMWLNALNSFLAAPFSVAP
jgi:flagellar biosynthetic protein FliR